MPIIATFKIKGTSPYSQSRPKLEPHEPNESEDDYRKRTWRAHLHADKAGEIYIPPSALKNCISESAKFMNIRIPGQARATYTKHFEAGVACVRPIMRVVHVDDVESETLFLPSDGRRGGGSRVWKQYPVLREWNGSVELIILDEMVLQTRKETSRTVLEDVVEGAGQYIGLGRYRPRNNGWYGRFTVENFTLNK